MNRCINLILEDKLSIQTNLKIKAVAANEYRKIAVYNNFLLSFYYKSSYNQSSYNN